jgi:hypothetical protein
VEAVECRRLPVVDLAAVAATLVEATAAAETQVEATAVVVDSQAAEEGLTGSFFAYSAPEWLVCFCQH